MTSREIETHGAKHCEFVVDTLERLGYRIEPGVRGVDWKFLRVYEYEKELGNRVSANSYRKGDPLVTLDELIKETPREVLVKTFEMTEDEFREGSEGFEGRCLACGETAFHVEPDARNYQCDECGAAKVYGLEELLLMGCIGLGVGDDQDRG